MHRPGFQVQKRGQSGWTTTARIAREKARVRSQSGTWKGNWVGIHWWSKTSIQSQHNGKHYSNPTSNSMRRQRPSGNWAAWMLANSLVCFCPSGQSSWSPHQSLASCRQNWSRRMQYEAVHARHCCSCAWFWLDEFVRTPSNQNQAAGQQELIVKSRTGVVAAGSRNGAI